MIASTEYTLIEFPQTVYASTSRDPDPPAQAPDELVSRKTVGELNLLSPRQRNRFWACFKKTHNERKALNVAKSSRGKL